MFLQVVRRLLSILCALVVGCGVRDDSTSPAQSVASLIEPAKLATLKERGANPRVQKAVALLEGARLNGKRVSSVAAKAVKLAGYKGDLAKLTVDSLVRNHGIANKLGVLNRAGLADMRRGQSPTIQRGPYKGDELSVDHIVPRAVAPELDNVIANLELMPLRMNESKSDKIGERQLSMARQFRKAGLLSAKRLAEIERRARK